MRRLTLLLIFIFFIFSSLRMSSQDKAYNINEDFDIIYDIQEEQGVKKKEVEENEKEINILKATIESKKKELESLEEKIEQKSLLMSQSDVTPEEQNNKVIEEMEEDAKNLKAEIDDLEDRLSSLE